MHREDIAISLDPYSSTSSSCFTVSDSSKSPSMQADGWISAPALPLFPLLDSAEGLHPKAGGKEQGSWCHGSFCRIRQEAGEGAPKEAGAPFHLFPLPVGGVYALHVCGLVYFAVLRFPVSSFLLLLSDFVTSWVQTRVFRNVETIIIFFIMSSLISFFSCFNHTWSNKLNLSA